MMVTSAAVEEEKFHIAGMAAGRRAAHEALLRLLHPPAEDAAATEAPFVDPATIVNPPKKPKGAGK